MKTAKHRFSGGELCHAHIPPTIMITYDFENWRCPACDNERVSIWKRSEIYSTVAIWRRIKFRLTLLRRRAWRVMWGIWGTE